MVVYEAGVAYETGPWGVSFSYIRGENEVANADIDKFMLGLNYNLATGVKLGAYGVYEESDSSDPSNESNGDGFIIGTGIKVSF